MSSAAGVQVGQAARRPTRPLPRSGRRCPAPSPSRSCSSGAIGMVLPFLWMFATSMQSATTAYDLPPSWLPFPLTPTNYEAAVTGPVPLLQTMLNSFIVAFVVAIVNVITAPMAGFAFAQAAVPVQDAAAAAAAGVADGADPGDDHPVVRAAAEPRAHRHARQPHPAGHDRCVRRLHDAAVLPGPPR